MFDATIQTTGSGAKFQQFSCDEENCKNKSAIPVGSKYFPRNWDIVGDKHYCNSSPCRHRRGLANRTDKKVSNVEKISNQLAVAGEKPLGHLAYQCLRCDDTTNNPKDWLEADGNLYCSKMACRDYALTHPNWRMFRRPGRAA
ncbi:MAG: hypothetical protein WC725_02770 [Patescibacteria group bacterium]|jgi:hypothetical protein